MQRDLSEVKGAQKRAKKVFVFLAAVILAAAFFFAGVRYCILNQRIEVIGHNNEDYVCSVEIFGHSDYHFANWNPLREV